MEEYFKRFAVLAATIDERLSDSFSECVGQKVDADIAAQRLSAWCIASSAGDWGLFKRRLERDGLTFEGVLKRLATIEINPHGPKLAWLNDSLWIDAALRGKSESEFAARLQIADSPEPFVELIAPVLSACEQLAWQGVTAEANGLFSNACRDSFVKDLATQLSSLCAPALYVKFRERLVGDETHEQKELSRVGYLAFLSHMRESGLRELFENKPVLLRLIASICRQWIDFTSEFIARLSTDWHESGLLAGASPKRRVIEVSRTGDVHNHGRSVQLVRFSDGSAIVYKPKDLTIDRAWTALISRLNDSSAPFELVVPTTIVKDGYGWCQFIENVPCTSSAEVDNYFERAGAWLCLLHIFRASDMHEENLVAWGEHPVPVDLETLLQPGLVPDVSDSDPRFAYTLAGKAISDSVLATGLLPGYGRTPGDNVVAHGGLIDPKSRVRRKVWRSVNTDAMRPAATWEAAPPNKNLPHCGGQRADIHNHIDAVERGYRAYASFLMNLRDVDDAASLTASFEHVTIRKLLKNTRFYSLLLDRLKDHRNMSDGATWSANLDFVARFADWDREGDTWWPLTKPERTALAELNIPLFMMDSSGETIAAVDSAATESGLPPGWPQVVSTLARFDAEVVEQQASIILVSLSTLRTPEESLAARGHEPAPGYSESNGIIAEHVSEIAHQLRRSAFQGLNSAAWIGLDWLRDSSVCQLAPLGADLYNGAPGVALFLAAYAKVANDDQSRDLALRGIAALRHDLLGFDATRSARALGIGGSSGLGSVVYAFTSIAELVDDPVLLEDTVRISRLFTADLISLDAVYDMMDGGCGAIVPLLKLYRATSEPEVLDCALACGRHVMAARTEKVAQDRRQWFSNTPLNGMSHGAAGFAYALSALARHSNDAERRTLIDTAIACIKFENESYSTTRRNWPDFRSVDPSSEAFWPCQWCHGAAGIGLARIGTARALMNLTDNEQLTSIRTDVVRAADATVAAWPYPTDSLCCGTLGGIEFLSEAADFLAAPHYRDIARCRVTNIAHETNARADYSWDIGSRASNIGLFRGVSGVGYTFLRQLHPSLPNILLWE